MNRTIGAIYTVQSTAVEKIAIEWATDSIYFLYHGGLQWYKHPNGAAKLQEIALTVEQKMSVGKLISRYKQEDCGSIDREFLDELLFLAATPIEDYFNTQNSSKTNAKGFMVEEIKNMAKSCRAKNSAWSW